MKNQFHVVCDPELYSRCSILASELGLTDSAFIRMLISQAWIVRKGGSAAQMPIDSAVIDVGHSGASFSQSMADRKE